MADYSFHELCTVFPLIPSDVEAIRNDIKANGQRRPIVLFEGKILDGRNRYLACSALQREPITQEFTGTWAEARAFVISENMARRHLDESQRAMVAAKLATMRHGGNRKRPADQVANCPLEDGDGQVSDWRDEMTADEAAHLMNVSRKSVSRAKTVIEKGDDALQAKVEAGEIAVSAAAKVVALPIEEQVRIASAPDPKAEARKAAANSIDRDVKARAAREVASIIAEHVPAEWWDAVKSNLYAAGAANIANELTNISGESIMDRRFGS